MTNLKISYRFKNRQLLRTALSHSSYAHECGDGRNNNERFEFLGDSLLGFLSAEYFYTSFPKLSEGELTKKRAAAVCEGALSSYAQSINLGTEILLGKGEEATGGRERASILSDAFEALLSAIYLDAGSIDCVREFLVPFLRNEKFAQAGAKDNKTQLQELVQRRPGLAPEYVLISQEGPAHEKLFTTAVFVDGIEVGRGVDYSKKRSEQAAAEKALARLQK
ncbi:MAG: ribonuclease III [Oscillospiraceae bacterium]|nr:ribonuclease III [Oscillospiraceae bacterium]